MKTNVYMLKMCKVACQLGFVLSIHDLFFVIPFFSKKEIHLLKQIEIFI